MHGTVPPPRPSQSSLPRVARLDVKLPPVTYLPALPDIAGWQIPTMSRGEPDLEGVVRRTLQVIACATSSRLVPIAAPSSSDKIGISRSREAPFALRPGRTA